MVRKKGSFFCEKECFDQGQSSEGPFLQPPWNLANGTTGNFNTLSPEGYVYSSSRPSYSGNENLNPRPQNVPGQFPPKIKPDPLNGIFVRYVYLLARNEFEISSLFGFAHSSKDSSVKISLFKLGHPTPSFLHGVFLPPLFSDSAVVLFLVTPSSLRLPSAPGRRSRPPSRSTGSGLRGKRGGIKNTRMKSRFHKSQQRRGMFTDVAALRSTVY